MARISITVGVRADAATTWRTVTAWERHGEWVPLTHVTVASGTPQGVGQQFTAVTGIGGVSFDDVMQVVEWCPPSHDQVGTCGVVKLGSAVRGTAGFTVTPTGTATCDLMWFEDIQIGPKALSSLTTVLVRSIGRLGLARTVRAMARSAEHAMSSDSIA